MSSAPSPSSPSTPSPSSPSDGPSGKDRFTALPGELQNMIAEYLRAKDDMLNLRLASWGCNSEDFQAFSFQRMRLTRDRPCSELELLDREWASKHQDPSSEVNGTWKFRTSMVTHLQRARELTFDWNELTFDSNELYFNPLLRQQTVQSIFPPSGTCSEAKRITINFDLMRQLGYFAPNGVQGRSIDKVWEQIRSLKFSQLEDFRFQVGPWERDFPPEVVTSLVQTFAQKKTQISYIGMRGEAGYYSTGSQVLESPEGSQTPYPPVSVIRIQLEEGYLGSRGRGSEFYLSMMKASHLLSSTQGPCHEISYHNVPDRFHRVYPGFQEAIKGTPNSIDLYRDPLEIPPGGDSYLGSLVSDPLVTDAQRNEYFKSYAHAELFAVALGSLNFEDADWWVDPPERPSTWDSHGNT
ncbi:hypothetical protein BCR39DRAFT_551377 [Naematelia encephala]|uniref:F-box domain-containing protein n=1 Tax=Naematelia encephala TaxID=71784 RepID=A0A1Y2AJ77_9TREE|nr:hypothetical protein BCR39DRAFT_551377 [Naematelia encephala]